MSNYIWKVKFKIDHLLTDHQLKDDFIEIISPHFPSTEKDKDYAVGQLTISLNNLNYSIKEIVAEGLRTVIALTNHVNLPVEITSVENPPSVLPSLNLQGTAHSSFLLKEPEIISYLWKKYEKIITDNHKELNFSIQWFMRAIKSETSIDKFIYSWITFNMLYGWLTEVKSEDHIKGIKALIGKGIPCIAKQTDIAKRNITILEDLAKLELIDRHKIDRAKNLRSELVNGTVSKILIGAIEAIGFIRHNIFHGSLVDRTTEAERCIWPLIHLNAEIIKQQLEKI